MGRFISNTRPRSAALIERCLDMLDVPVVGFLEAIAGSVRAPRLGGDDAGQRFDERLRASQASPPWQK